MSDKTLAIIIFIIVLLLIFNAAGKSGNVMPDSYYDGAPSDGIEATLGF